MKKLRFGCYIFDYRCANNFAHHLQKWAKKRGAEYFCHYFVPFDNFPHAKLIPVQLLNEQLLAKCEVDGSNFAKRLCNLTDAYAVASPCNVSPFVMDGVLYIPSHLSCNKGALDYFAPLQKACNAVQKQLLRFTHALGYNFAKSSVQLGVEQEYFLLPQAQNLPSTNNAEWAGQANNYLAPPSPQIARYWQQVKNQLERLGIAVECQHNEVAPFQQEITPRFCNATQACWNNQIVMAVLRKQATNLGYRCVLHEKPFSTCNGSGKHLNFSLWTDDVNLLEVGSTPRDNARFLLLITTLVNAIATYQDLLQFATLSPANCLRVGQREAPPVNINLCLGQQLHTVARKIANNSFCIWKDRLTANKIQRNRTVAMSFQQGRVEWRSVGASANCALPATALLTAFAGQLSAITNQLLGAKGTMECAQKIVANSFAQHSDFLFCGNNYKKTQQPLQLQNIAKSILSDSVVNLFESTCVATKLELAEWKAQFEQSHKLL